MWCWRRKNSDKDDMYIALMRFGKSQLVNGLTPGEGEQHLKDNNFIVGKPYFDNLFRRIFFHPRYAPGSSADYDPPTAIDPRILNDKWFLRPEAYFNLLEHDQLQEARKSSRNSFCVAIVAIIISIVSFIASAYFQRQPTEVYFKTPPDVITKWPEPPTFNKVSAPTAPPQPPQQKKAEEKKP